MDEAKKDCVRNTQEFLIDALAHFEEHYWPIYEKYGFTFPEAYAAFVMDVPIPVDEPKEPWEQ